VVVPGRLVGSSFCDCAMLASGDAATSNARMREAFFKVVLFFPGFWGNC
jgi:hypothetical protein